MRNIIYMKQKIVAAILIILTAALPATILTGYFYSQSVKTEYYDCGFSTGIKIALLSDMHFPRENKNLSSAIDFLKELSPDIVAVTGDVFDASATKDDLIKADDFYNKLTSFSQVYAVIGNHEIGSPLLTDYIAVCKNNAVNLLLDEFVTVNLKGKNILIAGVKDGKIPSEKNMPNVAESKLKADVSLLLAHRPELIKDYAYYNFDVVLTGHAHGGQVRLFGRGLYAPDQGFFPRYTSGRYAEGKTQTFVSRGLGDGKYRLRIFNPYDVLIITI